MSKECDVIGHVPVNPHKEATMCITYTKPGTTEVIGNCKYHIEICRFCNTLFVIKKNVSKGVED